MRIWMITLLLASSCNPIGLQRRLNGESSAQISESNTRAWCFDTCDRERHIQWCEGRNWLDKLLFCKRRASEERCQNECYIPYCKCNEKPEDWNYGMCKNYCEGRKNEKVDDKK